MIWVHLFIAILQLFLLIKFKKELTFLLIDKLDYKNLEKRDILSSDVMSLYVKALENPCAFSCDDYILSVGSEPIKVWATNEIISRAFYTHDSSLIDKVEEMNKKLTKYDKLLLDKICNRVKNGELHLINTFFEA